MKIVNIIGGLGNQMFQYAFAVALSQLFPNEDVLVDTQHYKNALIKVYHGNNFFHNGYEIGSVFPNAQIRQASPLEIMQVSFYIPNQVVARVIRRYFPKRRSEFVANQQAYVYLPDAFSVNGDCYYDGYWLTPKYFDFCRDQIVRTFSFRPFDDEENIRLSQLICQNNSVSIHVRRGDFVGASIYAGICSTNYYLNAIKKVKEFISNPIFFVFSNDQAWCVDNLTPAFDGAEVHFVDHNKGSDSFRDMQLMTLARCNVLANSTFSWWGSYLNQRTDQIVIAPSKWVNGMDDSDIFIDKWIKL